MSESKHSNQLSEEERLGKMREAVRDVPGPKRGPVTSDDVELLREAGLDELAEIAEQYAPRSGRRQRAGA